MELFKSQVLLLEDSNGDLVLYSTTYFDSLNMKTSGYQVATELDAKNSLKVELYAESNTALRNVNMKYINPVVHLINLGQKMEIKETGELEGRVVVDFYTTVADTMTRSNGDKDKKKTSTTTVKATSNGRVPKPFLLGS